MSISKTLSLNRRKTRANNEEAAAKRGRFGRCFSVMQEISIEPAAKSLKHLDSNKLKLDIKRWAKAVVAYARQVSGRFGSSRKSDDPAANSRQFSQEFK